MSAPCATAHRPRRSRRGRFAHILVPLALFQGAPRLHRSPARGHQQVTSPLRYFTWHLGCGRTLHTDLDASAGTAQSRPGAHGSTSAWKFSNFAGLFSDLLLHELKTPWRLPCNGTLAGLTLVHRAIPPWVVCRDEGSMRSWVPEIVGPSRERVGYRYSAEATAYAPCTYGVESFKRCCPTSPLRSCPLHTDTGN